MSWRLAESILLENLKYLFVTFFLVLLGLALSNCGQEYNGLELYLLAGRGCLGRVAIGGEPGKHLRHVIIGFQKYQHI